jgi:hypothetical protein
MSFTAELQAFSWRRGMQLLVLGGLLAFVAGQSMWLKFCVLDLDIWWHLKVGDWIIQHAAVPHTGILSRTVANRPWVAYSWGYEVLLSLAYRWFGLVGIGVFGVLLTLAVAYSIFWMSRRLSGRFRYSSLIAVVTCAAFIYNLMPRPVFFSMTLFSITLALVLEAHRTGRVQLLYWLPPLFVLWANLHIQFVYGLFLIGLLLAVNLAQRLTARIGIQFDFLLEPTLPAGKLGVICAACFLASCIGPYSYHLYTVVYEYSQSKLAYAMIRELQPINFRDYSHYLQLLLTGAGFFALGWRKKVDLFKLSLLAFAAVVAFRTMRDSWFICIPAAACLADFPAASEGTNQPSENWFDRTVLAIIVAIFLLVFAPFVDFNQGGLDRAISSMYPVKALNFLRLNPPRGPLYNNLNWGGFLTWYMPDYPVAIDGRNDLYGEELDRLFFNTERGEGYSSDPYLNESGVVLLESKLPLVKLLKSDPRFVLVYEDQLASVFVRNQTQQQ